MNAYTLSFATFILLAAALGDRFGRRRLFVIGIAVFTLSSIAAGLSTDPGMLIVSRAAQGLGAAAVLPLSLALLAGSVPARLRAVAIGVWGGVSGLGVATGPLVGGAVVDGWNWQGIFWINVPIGVVSIALALLALPESRGLRERIDVLGVLLAAPAVYSIVYAIVRGNDAGWDSLEVIGSLVIGGGLLLAFVLRQWRAPAPLLPLRLFRDRNFAVTNVVGLVFSFGIFGAIFLLIQFLQVVQGYSPFEAGVLTMPWTLAPMVVAPLSGLLASRVGTRIPIVAGLVLQAAGLLWIALVMTTDAEYSAFVPPFLLAGIGMGLVFAPVSTAVLATLGEAEHAKASGANSTVREIGVALGIAVLTAVFTGAGGELTPTGYVDAAIPAVLTGAAVLAGSALAALALPGRRASL